MNAVYQSYVFESSPVWNNVPTDEMRWFNWEGNAPFRPNSFFQLCFVKGQGLHARLWTDETDIRAVCKERDAPVWEDSCLECFFEPVRGKGYLNVEMNPRGVFLAQWGKGREDRISTKNLSALSPVVSPLPQKKGWGVSLFIPSALLTALCAEPFDAAAGTYRFCCFKCGDKTARPHWASFAPMGGNPPGFHAPDHFATLDIREESSMIAFRKIIDVCRAFGIEGDPVRYKTFTDGHINATFLVVFSEKGELHKYLVQNINTVVFKDPDALMNNVVRVTHYLRKRIREDGGDPERETLHFRKTTDGALCLHDGDHCWRIYAFIDHSFTYDLIEDNAIFRSAGESFGRFQRLLANYPIESLYETIPDFHHTPKRVEALKEAVEADCINRASGVQKEIRFALAREADAGVALQLLKEGKVPLRVTHNDTKLNNILFDETTKRGLCVIDLDTIMPGLSLYDFGDAIRFGAKTAFEDESDLSKVSISLDLFEAYTDGYLSACAEALTKAEIDHLAFSAKLMTYECGVRFLTDYLCGDTYFKIDYPDHNLVRARNQFKMVEEIERVLPQMEEIVQRIYQEKTADETPA